MNKINLNIHPFPLDVRNVPETKKVFKNIGDAQHSGDTMYDLAEQQQEEKAKTTEEWRRKKLKYFRGYNVGLFERKRDQGESRSGFQDYVTESSFNNIDTSLFDEEKIRDGTQMIFNLDADGYAIQDGSGFLGSQSFEYIPFMFYESQDDLDYWLDKTDLDEMLLGKPYKDDITWLERQSEKGKNIGRGAFGFAKNLPEMAAGAYRFLQPIDALGGIGPYDTFYPKDAEQEKQVEEMYEFPGYSQMMREKFGVEPWQTPSSIFDRDESLYKKTLFDDEAYASLSEKAHLRNDYAGKDDAYIINDLQTKYPHAPLEAIQEYLDMDVRPVLDMSEKDWKDTIYWSDRDALSHDIPGAVASIAGTFPVALGPLGAVGQGANLLKKGNKLSKMIKKAKEPLWAKSLDAGIGFGVPQATGEYAVRKLQETEDEDSIYPQ